MKRTGPGRWLLTAALLFNLAGCGSCPPVEAPPAGEAPATGQAESLPVSGPTEAAPVSSSTADTLPLIAAGNAYYVSPDGDDDNPGTEAEPWRTIQKAADTLVAGETVYIMAGTYEEHVVPANSGSPGQYIVYSAYPGHAPTIDGAAVDVPEWSGLFDIVGRSFVRVSGLRIVNAGPTPHNPGILVEDSTDVIVDHNHVAYSSDSGIGVWASHNVIVDGNEVEHACLQGYNEGISIGGTDGFEVRHNLVHHGQKEGIDPKDGSSNGKVYGNEVFATGAVGIYVDAWDKHTYNIEVFDNVVHDVAANAIALASEQGGLLENVKVYNNLAYHNKWVGIHVMACCIDTHPMRNLLVVNNTLYDNGWDPWGGGILLENAQAEDVVIRNNVCSQNLYFQLAVDPGVPAQHYSADHNLIDGFRGTEGEIYGDDYVEGDPLFVWPAGANLHLQPGSPAIDQGAPDGAPDRDIDGQPRPQGGGHDIGADEYVPAAARIGLPLVCQGHVP